WDPHAQHQERGQEPRRNVQEDSHDGDPTQPHRPAKAEGAEDDPGERARDDDDGKQDQANPLRPARGRGHRDGPDRGRERADGYTRRSDRPGAPRAAGASWYSSCGGTGPVMGARYTPDG